MRSRQPATDLEFLAYDDVISLARDLQPVNSAGRAARPRLQILDSSKIHVQPTFEQFSQFLCGIFHAPAIEVLGLPVKSRQNTREKLFVASVAVSRQFGTDEGFRTDGGCLGSTVVHRLQI